MMDNEILVVGTESGELLSVLVSTQHVEVVGSLEGGVLHMSASPDGELLAIITALGMLVVMTSDWEVLYEVALDKNTQLKDIADTKAVNQSTEFARITWRSDGKYFATLQGSMTHNSAKELHIWERDTGTLHACSKSISAPCPGLDWIPNGTRIATANFQDMSHQPARIIFFERNGLDRGSFDVSGPVGARVKCIRWNCNSDLLALLVDCGHFDSIQIWTVNNYHWYLKLEWQYVKESRINFIWHPEKPMQMFTWNRLGCFQLLKLCWDNAVTGDSIALVIDGSRILATPLTQGLIPPPMSFLQFKHSSSVCMVSLHELGDGGFSVASSLCNGTISLVALPRVDDWVAYEGSEIVIPDALLLGQTQSFPCMRLLSWLNPTTLLGVVSSTCNKGPVDADSFWPPWEQKHHCTSELLLELEVFKGEAAGNEASLCKSGWSFKCNNRTLLNKRVLTVVHHPAREGLIIHFEDGSLSFYTNNGGLIKDIEAPVRKLDYPSLWVEAIANPSDDSLVLLGMDSEGKLQANSKLVSKDCTGFSVHKANINGRRVLHALYTTRQDILFIENIEDILRTEEPAAIAHDLPSTLPINVNQEKINKHQRHGVKAIFKERTVWEKGARLITAMGGDSTAVILQTTRGNLETVYPRTLVIGSIVGALCDSKFNEAMLLARRHRINLNVLIDFLGWECFVQRCVYFVRQIKNLSHITELVCAVSNGNLAENAYQDLLAPFLKDMGDQSAKDDHNIKPFQGSKIQCIMHAIRKALEDEVSMSPKRELCILTTMAYCDPPELEAALTRVKKIREEELSQIILEDDADTQSKMLSAEEALKHLLWLSDSRLVFNAALGLYDLHLAAMVAANSQGDPKEFLPLLEELEKMPVSLMKYTIDYKLGRYESALRNLAAAGSAHFDQCLKLIKEQPDLFPVGKQLFQEGAERMVLLKAWGDYLLGEEKFQDAAAAFLSCSQMNKALGAYRAGGLWQCVIAVAGTMGYTQDEMIRLAHELREELQALGRPGDAAKIALEHCKEPDDAVHLYIEAREWAEAVRIASLCENSKSIEEQIKSAALECAGLHMAEFQEGLEKVGRYLARYLAVRQRRQLLESKLRSESREDVEDDIASDVSSNVSGMSVYTTGTRSSSKLSFQSSRKGNKQAAKSRSGKIRAGSPGEEVALVEHLEGMKTPDGTLEDIQKLLHILVLHKQNLVAEKLQHLVSEFQTSQHRAVLEAVGSITEKVKQPKWAIEILGRST
ncbi:hypothetical protein KP509_14G027500 [Ceratopteris richardii]|nr:hypothetical protein KP509_14G027500 [Ceratopteris richardii]